MTTEKNTKGKPVKKENNSGIKSRAGRPRHVPTEESRSKAKRYSAMGATQEDIAKILKINVDTLLKYYQEDMDDGRININFNVAGTLYQQVQSGNVPAMIFWLKTRARWRENDEPQSQQPVVVEIRRYE
jgi:hypothetical protein